MTVQNTHMWLLFVGHQCVTSSAAPGNTVTQNISSADTTYNKQAYFVLKLKELL